MRQLEAPRAERGRREAGCDAPKHPEQMSDGRIGPSSDSFRSASRREANGRSAPICISRIRARSRSDSNFGLPRNGCGRPGLPMTVHRFRKRTVMPSFPIDRQLLFGTGLQYEINRDVTAGAAWEFLDAGPAPFSNRRGPLAGTLQGHFSTNYVNFLALNVIWKF